MQKTNFMIAHGAFAQKLVRQHAIMRDQVGRRDTKARKWDVLKFFSKISINFPKAGDQLPSGSGAHRRVISCMQ